jgi:methenyltetrahydromethanopterin cyclohydrolase
MVDSTSDDVNLHKKSLALSDTRRTEANSTPQFKLTQRDKEQLKASYSDYKDDINNLIDTLVSEEFPVDNVVQHIERDMDFNDNNVSIKKNINSSLNTQT